MSIWWESKFLLIFFEIFILLCTPATSHSTTAALHSLLYHRKTQKLADWIFINIFCRFFNFGATIYFGNIVEDHTNIDVKKPVFGHIYFPPKLGKLYIHVLKGWKFDTFRNTSGTTDRRNRFSFFWFFDLGRRCVLYAIFGYYASECIYAHSWKKWYQSYL